MKLSAVKAKVAQANKPATMTVLQVDGTPYRSKSGAESTLQYLGTDSDKWRENREAVQRRNVAEQNETVDENKDAVRNKAELAAGVIVGWSGWEDDDDNELPCTRENVLALLNADHVLQQVWKKIFSHQSFFSDSSPS